METPDTAPITEGRVEGQADAMGEGTISKVQSVYSVFNKGFKDVKKRHEEKEIDPRMECTRLWV